MRDGPPQAGDDRRATELADWVVDAREGADRATGARSRQHPRPPEDAEPNTSERITLIDFLWEGRSGAQQVILVAREWLQ